MPPPPLSCKSVRNMYGVRLPSPGGTGALSTCTGTGLDGGLTIIASTGFSTPCDNAGGAKNVAAIAAPSNEWERDLLMIGGSPSEALIGSAPEPASLEPS
jgi:hypothetical protein